MNTLYAILLSFSLLNHTYCSDVFKKSSTEWAQSQQWALSIGLITLIISIFSFVLYALTYSVFLSFFLISFETFAIKAIVPMFIFIMTHSISLRITQKCIQKTPATLLQKLHSFFPLLYLQSSLLTATFIYLTHSTLDFLVASQRILGTILGFILILILFEFIAERLKIASVPTILKGTAIHLLTMGILSLALAGLSGTRLL